MLCTLSLCIVNMHWLRNSDGSLTIFYSLLGLTLAALHEIQRKTFVVSKTPHSRNKRFVQHILSRFRWITKIVSIPIHHISNENGSQKGIDKANIIGIYMDPRCFGELQDIVKNAGQKKPTRPITNNGVFAKCNGKSVNATNSANLKKSIVHELGSI